MLIQICIVFILFQLGSVVSNHFRNLDDSILFPLNWAVHNSKADLLESPDYEKLTLVSADQEEFQCLFPIHYGEIEDGSSSYRGPGPLSLLLPSLKKKSCTHKYEPYWSYNVCHGDQITQYHKEGDTKSNKEPQKQQQEYILGLITPDQLALLELDAKAEDLDQSPPRRKKIPEIKVDSVSTPYYAITYNDGSVCVLTGQPRAARVLHVCFEHGRNDVYSIKETATCQYEIIVLSAVLCDHPLYRKTELPESPVHCMPAVAGARRPRELLRVETNSLKLKMMPLTQLTRESAGKGIALGKVDSDYTSVGVVPAIDDDDQEEEDDEGSEGAWKTVKKENFPPQPLTRDQTVVKNFLSGEHCLDGGAGWWSYEFCYGREVKQYHKYGNDHRIEILLGSFDVQKHIEWIKKNPNRAPSTYQISHYYTEGAVCDLTGKPRTVEVRLKCSPPSMKVGVGSVGMYMLEPQPCQYVLAVETGMVCDLLDDIDQYGLLKMKRTKKSEEHDEDLPSTHSDTNSSEDAGDGDDTI